MKVHKEGWHYPGLSHLARAKKISSPKPRRAITPTVMEEIVAMPMLESLTDLRKKRVKLLKEENYFSPNSYFLPGVIEIFDHGGLDHVG